ncbi:cell division protein ZapA [Sphingopyxis yananensis]|uniref:cell division protein ZapA n=1 Tax=Sphingopyxis yananensis TaxID=2886687 RepID=UPI001D12E598|nr:cell division protein ZapA [Sphingopyxis yananensis]MCC2600976.1 cell division protein ZapA [Sphingopyxis yananensis]
MADVRLNIAGRHYDVHCSDGQEQQLLTLAAMVDEKAAGAVGTTEIRQLLFSALFLADELKEARAGIPKNSPEQDELRSKLAQAEAQEQKLAADLAAMTQEAQRLREQSITQVQQLADTQAALQAAHVALTEAEVAADNAAEQAEAATQALAEVRAANAASAANAENDGAPATPPIPAQILSALADRVEALADKFQSLT